MTEQGGRTSLIVAAEDGQLNAVHYLVNRGAMIEAGDEVRGMNASCSVLKYCNFLGEQLRYFLILMLDMVIDAEWIHRIYEGCHERSCKCGAILG